MKLISKRTVNNVNSNATCERWWYEALWMIHQGFFDCDTMSAKWKYYAIESIKIIIVVTSSVYSSWKGARQKSTLSLLKCLQTTSQSSNFLERYFWADIMNIFFLISKYLLYDCCFWFVQKIHQVVNIPEVKLLVDEAHLNTSFWSLFDIQLE